MIQDFQVFLNIVGQGLSWFFGLELSDWWAALVQNGTDKFWVAGIVIFLGLILVGGFFFWGLRFLSYCLIASYLGLILAGGESPSVWTMTAAILYVTVTLAAGSGKRGKHFKMAGSSALSVLILSGVLLVASAQIGVPLLQKAFGDVLPLRTRIQQTSLLHVLNQFLPEELKFQDGTGEYEGGSLEVQSDGPDFSGRTVVTVESDQKPENPVYWSRYMGNLYTGYSFNDEGDLDDPKNRYNIQYPKRKLAELKAFCDANPQETPQDIVDFIVNTLRDNTVYNLQVDSPPDGKDFIEYFFFEKKEGYCIHYAATAVMMLRMYGIPARYVTGFLIPPSLFFISTMRESGRQMFQMTMPMLGRRPTSMAAGYGWRLRHPEASQRMCRRPWERNLRQKTRQRWKHRPKGPARRPEPNWQLKRRAAVKMQRPPEMKIRRKTAGQQGPLESLRPLAVFRKTSVLPGFSCLWFFCWQWF